ncbi:MAG: hypothetical protein CM1200mP40_05240 [Gammaproteobacteria bacterium]|nr:MAG: hypothetical protein CM1200mP40_05240 [Gammaproteobacteria bacterium]
MYVNEPSRIQLLEDTRNLSYRRFRIDKSSWDNVY